MPYRTRVFTDFWNFSLNWRDRAIGTVRVTVRDTSIDQRGFPSSRLGALAVVDHDRDAGSLSS
ncbi:MAG: hypothetical protein ACRDZ5_12015 [Acidimicrobiales bacterium]